MGYLGFFFKKVVSGDYVFPILGWEILEKIHSESTQSIGVFQGSEGTDGEPKNYSLMTIGFQIPA